MPLTADEILAAFRALGDELGRQGQRADIAIIGGAALVLLFRARESTRDVDAYFFGPDASLVRNAATIVAARLELPDDWLNDGAKGYLVGISEGAVLFHSSSLTVRSAGLPQLLAMKLAAWRDAIDRSDAELLLRQLAGSAEEIWAALRPFVPPHLLDKASYAFEDLWERLHGHP